MNESSGAAELVFSDSVFRRSGAPGGGFSEMRGWVPTNAAGRHASVKTRNERGLPSIGRLSRISFSKLQVLRVTPAFPARKIQEPGGTFQAVDDYIFRGRNNRT